MMQVFRYILLLVLTVFAVEVLYAQDIRIRETHKVKRKETIFGIARQYGVTIEELEAVNPQMRVPDFKLKKGTMLNIPYHVDKQVVAEPVVTEPVKPAKPSRSDMRNREIRIGVMLPLHDKDADGRRMIEYYRGVLMACDSLKLEGISVDVHAWNVSATTDLSAVLKEKSAEQCDLIIGPYYSNHVQKVADFADDNNIKVLMPFSVKESSLSAKPSMFYAANNDKNYNETVMANFINKFAAYKTIFVDCNDSLSRKGSFTMELRRRLSAMGRSFSITNLNSRESDFSKAFSRTQPNVVVLNTARSPQLNVAFSKLNNMVINDKDVQVSMFGYSEWMMYTTYNLDNYYQFDTYIPAPYYLNPLSPRTARIEQKFRWNFHADMQQVLPRLAIMGFDHAYFFIKGLKMYGADFDGAKGKLSYTAIQSPLGFLPSPEGAKYNQGILFVHYTRDNRIETIHF